MYHTKNFNNIVKELSSSVENGLSTKEAEKRLLKNGPNKLNSDNKEPLLSIIFKQFKDPMIYILIITGTISAFIGEITDTLIIAIVIIINASIGTLQESKASKALDSLKNLNTPKAIVKRDGKTLEIPVQNVVIGDIVFLDAGRYVPADLRLIETASLKIDESTFTGESLPSEKDAKKIFTCKDDSSIQIGDRVNMAYMSTLVTYGRGIGIVVNTGMNTEIGSIFKIIDKSSNNITPLQISLKKLSKILGIAAILICLIIFIIGILEGKDFIEMLLTSLSLAVAAIPEELPAIVAIVMAFGVQKMIKENAIIKKLPAVETLGSVNIICSDKTGTLTLNKMTVKKFFSNNCLHEKIDKNIHEDNLLLDCMLLCNDATFNKTSQSGDPTEIALLDVLEKNNILKKNILNSYQRVNEIPFDSDRKLMTTVNKYNNKNIVFTKGALDSLINICTKISLNENIVCFTKEIKESVIQYANLMSDKALRVLAFAYKQIDNDTIFDNKTLEKDLIFIGLTGMIDPPRKEVKNSISICKKAGITPVMITGDHKNTAFAIASELGIASNINECITGAEIDNYNQKDFDNNINNYKVFARVSPEHKVKIVNAFKSNGNIVSMTGDGVNDAPSLKQANIGIAMGITGTDVAKNAADIILTDDNFTTIVKAIKEGRMIYTNIKKSIIFLLACNLGEIICILVSILLNWPTPLSPIHILWINLITDSLPALSLGVDPIDNNIMNEKPRNSKDNLFKNNILFLILNGILIGTVTLLGFHIGLDIYNYSLIHAQTLAFVILSMSQLFFALTIRNKRKLITSMGILTNEYLIYSIILGIALQSLIITLPYLNTIFKLYCLTGADFILTLVLSLLPLITNEFIKLKKRNY